MANKKKLKKQRDAWRYQWRAATKLHDEDLATFDEELAAADQTFERQSATIREYQAKAALLEKGHTAALKERDELRRQLRDIRTALEPLRKAVYPTLLPTSPSLGGITIGSPPNIGGVTPNAGAAALGVFMNEFQKANRSAQKAIQPTTEE